ncbi:MAG TPA: STY0301 family protein [Thermoanaerobaculia bacterium]|nr:STY0301 family protein [Thermoanaerobaculia bacterium]
MTRILTAALTTIVLAAWPVSAVELTCPKARPPHDWQGFRVEPSRIRLLKEGEAPKSLGAVAMVSIFDGSPTEMADLVPDNPDSFGKEPLVWTLSDNMKHGVWIVCRYRNSTVAFGKAVPPGVRKCSVEGAPGKGFKIRCQ